MNQIKIKTVGELKKSGYILRSVKEEMRENLSAMLSGGINPFHEIKGYEETVIPQVETAVLSKHNIILLGLRGQAKTRIARLMIHLLDEFMPVLTGSEIHDDPFHPVSRFGNDLLAEMGDEAPIEWIHRSERYTEKLATPDVSVADLIGDLDPIKAASMKLNYADERVIHFGLIPRSHRGIFVINELPDLQARIQVALFNILQEGDLQIRGFKLRLPLDIAFVFTANPEDYTNRGAIVTPLKDRIDSQILTHYPSSMEVSKTITKQEAAITKIQQEKIKVHELLFDLVEQIAFEARKSDLVDQKSGVSARLGISAIENLYSHAERRMLINHEGSAFARIADLYGAMPSITGKVELVYEGELEGAASVAKILIGKSIRNIFENLFPNPERSKKSGKANPFASILNWFNEGNTMEILHTETTSSYEKKLELVPGLKELALKTAGKSHKQDLLLMMELILHGLAEFSQISKLGLGHGIKFGDLMSAMLNMKTGEPAEDQEGGYYEER